MNRRLHIIGAGGQGRVLLDLARELGEFDGFVFLEIDPALIGNAIDGVDVLDQSELAKLPTGTSVAVGIGLDNRLRLEVLQSCFDQGLEAPILAHPKAFVSAMARLEAGTAVMAGASVQTGARLGVGCIVNTGAVVDHDCELAPGVHVAPCACLCGQVRVGQRSWIGAGASVIQGVHLGDDCLVGAGAAVVKNAPAGSRIVGVPGCLSQQEERG